MQKLILSLLLIVNSFCFAQQNTEINTTLEQWHKAAADANFEAYFGLMTEDAIFIGTDPTENWNNSEFKAFAKPYFDKGKAWSFSTLERNIFAKKESDIVWFDELLDTQMGICRGSGILQKTANGWKIKHYVLSIAIPNENVAEITKLKKEFDTTLMQKLRTTIN
ncbi:SnoaL-like protein [Aquimarina sp. MAR_2010_214]|uniref:nuclear transport factor 2 family protein n=1 Tax=Aquimarina sp. MAR_2010_214 TaxID=1250026 RepID=UPI000C70FCAF|nr:nuclear transport factor 2 family protein [Aquimarina sp. MAR_2010_214]PKV49061.1 SnoaL-like protein [Aquimarina sp. MAR_2010_214]